MANSDSADTGKNKLINRVEEWNRFGSHVVSVNKIHRFNKFMVKYMDRKDM